MSEPQGQDQGQGRRRRSPRPYLILVGLAVVLAGVMLVVTRTHRGHLTKYEWWSIAFLGVALATAALIAVRTRRSGATSIWTTRPGAVAGFLEAASSVLSILASVASLIATLIPLIPHQAGARPAAHASDLCAVPLGARAYPAVLSSSEYQGGDIQISDVHYSLYSNDGNAATAQLHSALYGRLTGHLPAGYVIYVVGHWDSNSTSTTTHVHGYPHYYPRGEIHPQADGCWSLPSRNVGEPGSVGLSEHVLFMLASPAAARVLQQQEGAVDERAGTGLNQTEMNALDAVPVDYFELTTTTYDPPS